LKQTATFPKVANWLDLMKWLIIDTEAFIKEYQNIGLMAYYH